MTGRKIVINRCDECPHRDHNGGFGSPAYVPVCRRASGKELPYMPVANRHGTGCNAAPTNVIPTWCPLEANV